MNISVAGLQQILFCDAGTLGTTNANAFALGLRGAGSLDISPFKPGKDYRNRTLRNMMNHKYDIEALQPTIKMLKGLHGYLNLKADVQVLTNPQSDGNPYCFKYAGNNGIGIGFEYGITPDKRYLKPALERAFDYTTHKTFMDAADDPSGIVSVAGITGEGADFSKYHEPNFLKFEASKGTSLVDPREIVDRSLVFKTSGKKTIYNEDLVSYLTATLSITGRNAAISKILEILNKDMAPSILWREGTTGTCFEDYEFNAGCLTLSPEVKNSDDDFYTKITFEGDIPIYQVQFFTGATYGGDVADDGTKGGTVKFGF
ncbi:MAG TPA: hypothetical protein VHO03_03640 [Ignavibacteriales bacterium]|nr:hypothetical protein [Ignavibacteriales bacterium]